MFKKFIAQVIFTVLFFEVFGLLFYMYHNFSNLPEGREYSLFGVTISIVWVIIIWGLFLFSGFKKANGVLVGYVFVIGLCCLIFPIFLYIAPIISIHDMLMDLCDGEINYMVELMLYTGGNFVFWLLGWALFQLNRKKESV